MQHPTHRLALAEIVHMLALLFYDPEETIAGNEGDFFVEFEAIVASCDDLIQERFATMRSIMAETDIMTLRVDYAALFVGPGELLACPYGSVYLETDRQLWGKTTRAVVELYRQAGVGTADDQGIIPDHIAVELEFLHVLLFKLASEDDPVLSGILSDFCRNYFLPMAKPLAANITGNARTGFYRLLGEMLDRLCFLLVEDVCRPSARAADVIELRETGACETGV